MSTIRRLLTALVAASAVAFASATPASTLAPTAPSSPLTVTTISDAPMQDPPSAHEWCKQTTQGLFSVTNQWGQVCFLYGMFREKDGLTLQLATNLHDRLRDGHTVYVTVTIEGRAPIVANVSGDVPQHLFSLRTADYRRIPPGAKIDLHMRRSGGGPGSSVKIDSFRMSEGPEANVPFSRWCEEWNAERHSVARSWGAACVNWNFSRQIDGRALYVAAPTHDRARDGRKVKVVVTVERLGSFTINTSGDKSQELFTARQLDIRHIPPRAQVVIRIVREGGGPDSSVVMANFGP